MEVRTFVDEIDVFKLIENLEKCKVMDDARTLLNAFVSEHIGIEYYLEGEDTESRTAYRNSKKPQNIKDETLRVIDDHFRRWNVIDEASEATLNAGRKHMDKSGILYDKGTIISVFGDMRNDIERVEAYIEAWRKEPVIKLEENTLRLRPKPGTEKYVKPMFSNLKSKGYIDEQTMELPWLYLCGMTDEIPITPIIWKVGLFELNVLIERFFVTAKSVYFDAPKGAITFICNMVVNEDGNEINSNSLKTTKSREYSRNPARDAEVWKSIRLNGML